VEWVLTQLVARGLTVDVLMNNAGLGDVGTLRTAPWERIQPMLSVNIVALTQLTQALLPGMVERGRGAILNVSSTASFLPIPSFAVYAATKAYVTSFSEALRAELTAKGVAVTALCPGPVKTEFGQVASRPDGKREFSSPGWLEVAVEDVAREAIAGLKANRPLVIPGFLMKLAALGIRLTPRWIFRLMFTLNAGKM
jgi:short-subunit dehydrogenase